VKPKSRQSPNIFLTIYVDDIILAGLLQDINRLKARLFERFTATGPDPLDSFRYLGTPITRDHKCRSNAISQHGYIQKTLEQFRFHDAPGRATPLVPDAKLQNFDESSDKPADVRLDQQAVGALLYATLGTRSDIAYATTVLRCFSAKPSTTHWNAIKHLFGYLNRAKKFQLTIYGDERQYWHSKGNLL
jgi:hypothetical protein